jgi:UDP-3-O-acyl-N-acetylglucosamine deacetylase
MQLLTLMKKLQINQSSIINRQSPQKEMMDSESERFIHYLDMPGSSSKYDQSRRLEKKEKERIKTENSNITNFPNSDTFFNHTNTHKNLAEEEESAKAMAPMTYTNMSSDDMIEDSMNVEIMEPKDQVYEDYNKLKY